MRSTRECVHWASLVLLAGLFGLMLGHALLCMLLALLAALAWQLYNVNRLERWLAGGRSGVLPESVGAWGVVFDGLYRLQQHNRDRKRQLGSIVRRFQESSAAMPDGIVLFERDHRIVWFNQAAGEFLGLRRNQDYGQHVANLVRHPRFTRYLHRADYRSPVEIPAPDRIDQWLSLQIVHTGDTQFLLLVRDITLIRRADRVRRDFVANASHELRTPLTVIRGYLDGLIEDRDELDPAQAAAVQAMATQAGRMQQLVADLMMLLKLESAALPAEEEWLEVGALLEQIAADARRSGGTELTVTLEVDPALRLRGSRSELVSVAQNLVTNAINYTPADGQITIRWRAEQDRAVLAVQDNGCGIPAHLLPRLTERFFRVPGAQGRLQPGTGLGLAIVQQQLERHGADLQIDSRPGEGSCFRCLFPAARVQYQQAA